MSLATSNSHPIRRLDGRPRVRLHQAWLFSRRKSHLQFDAEVSLRKYRPGVCVYIWRCAISPVVSGPE